MDKSVLFCYKCGESMGQREGYCPNCATNNTSLRKQKLIETISVLCTMLALLPITLYFTLPMTWSFLLHFRGILIPGALFCAIISIALSLNLIYKGKIKIIIIMSIALSTVSLPLLLIEWFFLYLMLHA